MMNKTSYVTSVTMQFDRESLVTCLTCRRNYKKMCTLKFDMNKYSSLKNNIQEMAKYTETQILHMQELPCTTAT